MGDLKRIKIEGRILIDGVPIAQNLSHVYDSDRSMGRFKWDYLSTDASGVVGAHPVDVSYGHEHGRMGMTSGGVRIYGEDDITKASFVLDCIFDVLDRKLSIKGRVGQTQVSEKVKTLIDMQMKVFKLIRPILTGQKS